MKRTNSEPSTAFICWQREATSPCLRIELQSGEIHIFPYSLLLTARLTRASNGSEILHLSFSTHEVEIEGQALRDLAIGIQDFAIKWLRPIPERYSPLAATDSIISAIRVTS